MTSPAGEAIAFALEEDDPGNAIEFLRCWLYGDFEAIRREWPEAPETIFLDADPDNRRPDRDTAHAAGYAEGIEDAAKVAGEMRENHCKPAGTQYEEGGWDHGHRVEGKIRALAKQENADG